MYNISWSCVCPLFTPPNFLSYTHQTSNIFPALKHTHTPQTNFKSTNILKYNKMSKQKTLGDCFLMVNYFWADMPSVSPLNKINFSLYSNYQFSIILVRCLHYSSLWDIELTSTSIYFNIIWFKHEIMCILL